MKAEILFNETQSGNSILVRAVDAAEAEIAAFDFLNDVSDTKNYRYETCSAYEVSEYLFEVPYNVYDV
jgi:hypothetical protein